MKGDSEGKESCSDNESGPASDDSRSSSNEVSRSSSGNIVCCDMTSRAAEDNSLHLQVASISSSDDSSVSTGSSSSQQSSPRPSTTSIPEEHIGGNSKRTRGTSSSSTLSIGQISYRDLNDIQDEFKIIKILHDGQFSKILLTKQDSSQINNDPTKTQKGPNKFLVLKAIPSGGLFTEDFQRELRYNYFLSPHPNIVNSFNVSFNWASTFNVYVQEYAPFGNLSLYLTQKSLSESQVKLITNQICLALEFMHSFKLVHQDVQPENILIFKQNMSRVKLCDFGSTQKEGTLLTKGYLPLSSSATISGLPPELSYLLPQERFECRTSSDVWQMGILICHCLSSGNYPWTVAEFSDPVFRQYTSWLKRKSLKVPEPFKRFTPRLVRLLKRFLEPKPQFRSEIREVYKYLGDAWIKPSCSRRSISSSRLGSNGEKLDRENSCNKSKLVILSRNGINLLARRNENNEEGDNIKCANKQADSIKGKLKERPEDDDELNMAKRVEKWVATAVAATTTEQGNAGSGD